jgi:glucose/arabinose dehydrogenase/fibronectin type 3 domain-containing protein
MKGVKLVVTLLLAFLSFSSVATTLPTGFTEVNLPRPDGAQQWNEAVGITFTPSGRMFVWERTGRVWIIDQTTPVTTPFLDISPEVLAWHDHGMLGFALSPAFEQNGFVYMLFAVDRHHLMNCDSPVDGAPVCNGSYSTSTTWLPDAQWLDPPTNTVPNPGFKKATLGRVVRYQAVKPAGDPDYRRATTIDYSTRHVLIGETTINGPKNTGFTLTHDSHGIGSLVFSPDGTLLVSAGDAATYNGADVGSVGETYFQSALDDGFFGPKENVGALRAQLIDSMNGKLLRIDPITGDGIQGNPFYDASAPRAPRSRVWAYGLRNPYRFTIRPGTGSHLREDANPGVIYLGDVGWSTWEDLHVIKTGGENLGWPLYEGQTSNSSYNSTGNRRQNLDAPNPLFGIGGCTQQFFFFQDMLKQQSLNAPSWPNPCNTSQQMPASVHPAVHSRPALDWNHSSTTLQSRFPAYDGAGNAVAQQIGTTAPDGTTVVGSPFQGNTSTGGVFYTGTQFPSPYRNTYFHGDYGGQWIKSVVVDDSNRVLEVQNFASGAGGVVEMGVHPTDGSLYYIAWTAFVRKVSYSPPGGRPPVAMASAKPTFGASPLNVQFSSAGSNDPDGGPVTFTWDFGDGSPTSTSANPSHVYTTATTAITNFDATLTVRDNTGLQTQQSILISLNNTPPVVHITSPVNGSRYSLSGLTPVTLSANISDAQTATQDLICQWQQVLYHTNHEHTEPFVSSCTAPATISPVGCDGEMYYWGFRLAVSDPYLTTRDETRVFPACPSGNPVLGADSASVSNGGTAVISVLANDSDPDGLNFQSIVIMDQPTHGTILGINTSTGQITYQHDGSPTASDSFAYSVADSIGAFGVPATVTLSVAGADVTAPSVPQNLTATAMSSSRIDLSWSAATDNVGGSGLAGYRVYRNGGAAPIATVTATTYSNTTLTANTAYTYTVRSFDNAGNESANSNVAPASTLPTPSWVDQDIGAVAAAGSFVDTGASMTITGSGADIWGTADEFHFAYQPLNGDGELVARVTNITTGHMWSKVGLMVRETAAANSRHGTIFLGALKGAAFQYRTNNGGTSAGDNGDSITTLPRWIRVQRQGNVIRGYFSSDGVNWTQRGTVTLASLPTSVLIGVAYTSHVDGTIGSATLDNVTLTGSDPTPDTTPPSVPTNLQATAISTSRIDLAWTASTDTGGSGLTGYRVFRNGGATPIATVATTSYSDTGLASGTQFTYTVRAVDGANNASADSTSASATTQTTPPPDTTAPSVPTNLQATAVSSSRIDLSWNASSDNVGGSGLAGYRVYRDGGTTPIATVTATSYSNTSLTANTSYTYQVRSYDNAGNESGLSTSASATTAATASWSSGDIGAVAAAGSFTDNGTSLTITGSGADIWSTADEFQFAYRPLDGDGTMTARVTALTNGNIWSKVGLMVRESTAANSRHGTMFLGAGKGAAFQYRVNNGGTSAGDNGDNVLTIPRWIRVERAGNIVRGFFSSDGVNWTQRGTITLAGLPTSVLIGVAYTSHVDGSIGSATVDNVSITTAAPPTPDTTAPTVPMNLQATAISTSRIDLSWTASTDAGGSGLAGYRIFRDGGVNPIATVTTTTFSDTGLAASTLFTYTVRAVDGANNLSANSSPASATTQSPPAPDTTPPGVPGNLQASAVGSSRIDLSWSAVTDNAGGSGLAGYRIFRDGGTTPIATVTATSYSNTSLSPNTSYSYAVRSYDNAGNESALSGNASATTGSAPTWSNGDIGAVAAAGSFTDNGSSLSISGSGADIWGTADEFQFAYRTLTGDGDLVARVNTITNPNVWSKVGLMVRESLAASSRHGTVYLASGKGSSFQFRQNNAGTTAGDNGDNVLTLPRWIRIQRAGDVVRGYFSADGVNWTQRGTVTLATLPATVYVGIAMTSHLDGTIATSTLDSVSLNLVAPPTPDTTPPTVPQSLGATAGTAASFAPQVSYTAGTNSHSVATADLNGDGKLDLAVVNAASDTVSVFFGAGNGTFGTQTAWAVGDEPKSVKIADLNGDGKLDLVTANQGDGSSSVLLNTGSGAFSPKVDYPACNNNKAHEVAVADFNRDTRPDLALTCHGNNFISVLLGNGDGSFGAATNFTVGSAPHSIVALDFNGDGNPDVAVANLNSDNVSVRLGNGTGGFAAAVNYTVGDGPHGIRAGDLNADGKLDLVTVNENSNNVTVLLGAANGAFTVFNSFPTGVVPKGLVIVDVDGDGALDVVNTDTGGNYPTCCKVGGDQVSVLYGNSTGNLSARQDITVGLTPFSITSGDFNNDGRPDLATANWHGNSTSVLLNQNGSKQVQLNWQASTDTGGSGVAGYEIYRDSVLITTSTATSYTDRDVTAGTTYTYRVRAFDAATPANFSAQSAPATVTP